MIMCGGEVQLRKEQQYWHDKETSAQRRPTIPDVINKPFHRRRTRNGRVLSSSRGHSRRRQQPTTATCRFTMVLMLVCCLFCLHIPITIAFLYPYEHTMRLSMQSRRERHVVALPSNRKNSDESHSSNNNNSDFPNEEEEEEANPSELYKRMNAMEENLLQRISQLEQLVSSQQVQIRRLLHEQEKLTELTNSLGQIIRLLRDAGEPTTTSSSSSPSQVDEQRDSPIQQPQSSQQPPPPPPTTLHDAAGVFSSAPATVLEAADAAGAALLAGILAGQQRLLVDVRDAELCTDAATLVQFVELAVLPVAAGLEGMQSRRNRLKVVLPTVSHLLTYRRHMALAAPDVVALSTLGLDPVEPMDNLVVIVVPDLKDSEGWAAMNELLEHVPQPCVVVNHHMVPTEGLSSEFEVAYHLRLLSVSYASGAPPEERENITKLEEALQQAQQSGAQSGTTRAMVIRAYPRPWHVFVDTSPDTDADFSIAATFETAPESHEIHQAIVECLEGSEEEDEIVAEQMQIALELGQLDRISEMLWSMGLEDFDEDDDEVGSSHDDDDDIFRDMFGEDSV